MKNRQIIIFVVVLVLITSGVGALTWLKKNQKLGAPGLIAAPIPGSIKMDFDWVYLRTQVGLDPAHGMWGVEEEFQPTSTTPTTTSPTSTTSPTTPSGPEGFDWMILGIFGGAGIGIVVIVIIVIFSRRGGSG